MWACRVKVNDWNQAEGGPWLVAGNRLGGQTEEAKRLHLSRVLQASPYGDPCPSSRVSRKAHPSAPFRACVRVSGGKEEAVVSQNALESLRTRRTGFPGRQGVGRRNFILASGLAITIT